MTGPRRARPHRRPPRPPAAVVFDCDGLLLDTETAWTRAYTTLFTRHSRPFGLREKLAVVGATPPTIRVQLERLLDRPGQGHALTEQLLTLAHVELPATARPLPGAVELVTELHGRLPLAVASNMPRQLLLDLLRHADLHEPFDTVLGSDDVPRPKPAPDLYLAACDRLDVDPARTVAFEDSPTGVTAARAAGLYVVGVPSWPGMELEGHVILTTLQDAAARGILT